MRDDRCWLLAIALRYRDRVGTAVPVWALIGSFGGGRLDAPHASLALLSSASHLTLACTAIGRPRPRFRSSSTMTSSTARNDRQNAMRKAEGR